MGPDAIPNRVSLAIQVIRIGKADDRKAPEVPSKRAPFQQTKFKPD